MYITYHLRKTSSDIEFNLCSNILQAIFYGYFRVYRMTDYLIKNTHLIYTPLAPLLVIYIMGLIWFITLFKQVYDERITLRYIMIDFRDKLLNLI
jgi:hypothetical protein